MHFKTPVFWYRKSRWLAYFLWPLSAIYNLGHKVLTSLKKPQKAKLPVFCVGNAVLGGAGKTPFTELLIQSLKELGQTPHILTRGYGKKSKAKQIKVHNHTAKDVGEEALLLKEFATTWVGSNRYKSAKNAFKDGASCVVMDDGLQHESLKKDVTFLVVDNKQGFGNGFLFPAGPLRESLKDVSKKITAICLVCEKYEKRRISMCRQLKSMPLFTFYKGYDFKLKPQKVIAFCGLGYPWKFFDSLELLGFSCQEKIIFPDHYSYSTKDLTSLIKKAKELNLPLITTQKDFVKIPADFQTDINVLMLKIIPEDETSWKNFLLMNLQN